MLTGESNVLLTQSVDTAKGLLQRLVGPSIDEMGLLWQDNVKNWRLKNQIKNLNKVNAIVEKHNINIRHVNLKVLFPYLDGVALEEDEELQNMWANLFCNYIDSSKNLTLTVYPSILKQLSTNEVRILNFMMLNHEKFNKMKNREIWESDGEIANLERLGLIRNGIELAAYDSGTLPTKIPNKPNIIFNEWTSQDYSLTPFGYYFLKACER